jgi:L-asparagine transporter-like permease
MQPAHIGFGFGIGAGVFGLYRVPQIEEWVPVFLLAMLLGLLRGLPRRAWGEREYLPAGW